MPHPAAPPLAPGGYLCLTVGDPNQARAYRDMADRALGELKGKNLACWCRAGQPCHADVLLRAANRDSVDAAR